MKLNQYHWGLLLSLALGTSACAIAVPGKDGTAHYLILGVGVVSVNERDDAILITDSTALGISISDRPGLKFAAGYSSSFSTSVPDGAKDVSVEIRKMGMFGPLRVTSLEPVMSNYSTIEGGKHGENK